MTTHDRIQLLAQHGQSPEFLGEFSACDLSDWLSAELGHADALETFTPHGPLMSRAVAPHTILHIVSGNTPHAAIQSLLRGLLLGSHNIVKLPSSGLPELTHWIQQLPSKLQNFTEAHTKLEPNHWQQAQAVIAIGSDDTIAQIQKNILPHQTYIPHGHKISIGIVSRKPHPTRPHNEEGSFKEAAQLAAKDICAHQQKGCLSPHAIYINETVRGDTLSFAQFLAEAMDKLTKKAPPSNLSLSLSEAGSIRNLREITRFRTANSNDYALWESANSLDWTIICETSPILKLSCLNRCVYVKPLPHPAENLNQLGKEARHLSTISLYPFNHQYAAELSEQLPAAHRICPLGQSQTPTLFWHHDGFAPLASLVRWKDLG